MYSCVQMQHILIIVIFRAEPNLWGKCQIMLYFSKKPKSVKTV